MATYTSKLGLKKPADTDYVDVADINGNMDTLDGAFARFAVCSTAAATAAKTATISGFKLFTGAVAYIKFSVKNTAANPTLNISAPVRKRSSIKVLRSHRPISTPTARMRLCMTVAYIS